VGGEAARIRRGIKKNLAITVASTSKGTKYIVPGWRYLLGIYGHSHSIFQSLYFFDSTVGVTIVVYK
jgi:hypothetical protein